VVRTLPCLFLPLPKRFPVIRFDVAACPRFLRAALCIRERLPTAKIRGNRKERRTASKILEKREISSEKQVIFIFSPRRRNLFTGYLSHLPKKKIFTPHLRHFGRESTFTSRNATISYNTTMKTNARFNATRR